MNLVSQESSKYNPTHVAVQYQVVLDLTSENNEGENRIQHRRNDRKADLKEVYANSLATMENYIRTIHRKKLPLPPNLLPKFPQMYSILTKE